MPPPNHQPDRQTTPRTHDESEPAPEFASVLDKYLADLQAGESPDRHQLLLDHPELAAGLEACLAGIEFIQRATHSAAAGPTVLGDFRVIREIGRGGMGVVYEAEQSSLHRRVALKVLRFGVADQDAMLRFQREAETVARLHHANIVPIFAVGCERGVHYYAMQLIEGRSLAQVQAEAQQAGTPLPHEDVARWGHQAAEALAHAHQRGVIHRDVKPSNLLLDPDGVVWLTDFGLAKRADEATLTVSGALMGTPRYMSPEQAKSFEHPVDRRSDVYSLGATLYELATGRPAFDSAPHLLIAQIVNDEPLRPRQARPGLPRDLETIILTCLAKEPGKRYQTSQALASDLLAVLESRPILARRVAPAERITRYIRKRGRLIKGIATAVAATVFLFVAAWLSLGFYAEWRLGRVELTNDGPPLSVQVFSESGDEPVGGTFGLIRREVLSLPDGDYRLRATGTGQLGRTFRFAVNRGEMVTRPIALHEGRLLGGENAPVSARGRTKDQSTPFALNTVALELAPGKSDLVQWAHETFIRRDGVTGQVTWDAHQPAKPYAKHRDPAGWLRTLYGRYWKKVLLEPAPDVDGDGTADLVWAFPETPSLLALSGTDGSMIWSYMAELDGPGGPRPGGHDQPGPEKSTIRSGSVLGLPAVADCDGDGAPDLIATLVFQETPQETARRAAQEKQSKLNANGRAMYRRIVTAVSGRTGRWLWTYAIDAAFTEPPWRSWTKPATVVPGRRSAVVGIAADSQWIGLDLATGRQQTGPIELGFIPIRPVQYADLDGDGEPEVLALGPGRAGNQQTLAAVSCKTGRELWTEPVAAIFQASSELTPDPDWPLVVDLEGDGRSEIVVPDSGLIAPRGGYRGLRVLEGPTGRTRWIRPMQPQLKAVDGLEHVTDAPDLDGDGARDLIAVSRFDGRNSFSSGRTKPFATDQIHVDALSGKDGHPLWWWYENSPRELFTQIMAPRWWGRGPDGWPLLAIAVGGMINPDSNPTAFRRATVHILEASSGREVHTVEGLTHPEVADFDGDGLTDLWGEVDGEIRAFRGEPPEAWRALGNFSRAGEWPASLGGNLHPTVDFDGDGIGDTLGGDSSAPSPSRSEPVGSRTVVARSGRDGRVLWKTMLEPRRTSNDDDSGEAYGYRIIPLPTGDLDGDDTPDVFVERSMPNPQRNTRKATLPLDLLSGRNGNHLWSAGPLPLTLEAIGYSNIRTIALGAVGPRVPPDVLVHHASAFVKGGLPPLSQGPFESHLARLSGRDGRVLWDIVLTDRPESQYAWMVPPPFVDDVDGDGSLDALVLVGQTTPGMGDDHKLNAVSLHEGKLIWSKVIKDLLHTVSMPHVALADLDGDKQSEIVIASVPAAGRGFELEVKALNGRDGSVLWTWRDGSPTPGGNPPARMDVCLADLSGNGLRYVCVGFNDAEKRNRLIILDAHGHEIARRELPGEFITSLNAADSNGDRRDELLLCRGDRFSVLGGDLKELWSPPALTAQHPFVVPASPGSAGTVVVYAPTAADMTNVMPRIVRPGIPRIVHPPMGLDGDRGTPRWAGQFPPQSNSGFRSELLDPGNGERLPLLISPGMGTTACRSALRTTPDGRYQPPRGNLVKPGLARNDPRWLKPLPWLRAGGSTAAPLGFLAVGGLALVNVVLPLLILRLAAGRRPWSVRALMALPVAAAVPLMAFLILHPAIQTRSDPLLASAKLEFILGSLAGIPVVVFGAFAASSLARRRFRTLAALAGLTLLTSLVVGAAWLWVDLKVMPAIEQDGWRAWSLAIAPGPHATGVNALPSLERYDSSAWYLAVVSGVYAAGLFFVFAWTARAAFRALIATGRRAPPWVPRHDST